jgi:DNA ligase-1
MRSSRHASGFALRFPRIVRLRPDKPPSEIDRLSTVERMHEQLQAGVSYRLEAGAG